MFRARLRARLCRGKEGLHRAPTFVRHCGGYTHILLLFLSSTHYCPFFHPLLSEIYPYHSSTLKRRPQTPVTAADLVWVCAPPRTIRKWLRRLAFRSCGPGRKILAAAAADLVWVCAPPRTICKWLRRLAFWILLLLLLSSH